MVSPSATLTTRPRCVVGGVAAVAAVVLAGVPQHRADREGEQCRRTAILTRLGAGAGFGRAVRGGLLLERPEST
jgi:hypothetical protein